MKAVLLAGGQGTRLREETEFRPKPMVEIGGRPILWHIMKNLSECGIKEFIVATGYKSEMIKDYFLHYEALNKDFTIELGRGGTLTFHGDHEEADWKVTVAYTGETTNTGGRVLRVARYLDDEPFFVTYGDGLADVDVRALVEFHQESKCLATVTTVQPSSRFGIMDVDEKGVVRSFAEKPKLEGWVNVGFFILDPRVLAYLDVDAVLEEEPLARLAREGELAAYRHEGFWQPMDTYRELLALKEMWAAGKAPWWLK